MSETLIRDAMAALGDWMAREGLPTFETRAAVTHAALQLHDSEVELMLCYFLDAKGRLIEVAEVARGAESHAAVSSRHIARRALLANADSVICVHSHPEGDPAPSEADKTIAERIDRRLAALGILAIGHHVVARGGFADIRTGHIVRLEDLPGSPAPTTAHCCPTCSQPWRTSNEH